MTFEQRLPKFLLSNVIWDFGHKGSYQSQEQFNQAVLRHYREAKVYADEVNEEDWTPSKIELCSPRIQIKYYADPAGHEDGDFHFVDLQCDSDGLFTSGELLFKIHNATIGLLRDCQHRYFEGLELCGYTDSGTPIYTMIPGS